jgi:hypothetical protein
MSTSFIPNPTIKGLYTSWNQNQQKLLLQGEILVQTRSHNIWGGCVTALMYLPLSRLNVWQQITNYSRWVEYFPDITKSQIISPGEIKRLYQKAEKAFLFFTAQVEIHLNVIEVLEKQVHFRMEKGTFEDFSAYLELQDLGDGTLLMYTVKATPNIHIPSIFIQQAMNFELPNNMRNMRHVLCNGKFNLK